jgi:DNA-binding transcriptional ArsR family regulator
MTEEAGTQAPTGNTGQQPNNNPPGQAAPSTTPPPGDANLANGNQGKQGEPQAGGQGNDQQGNQQGQEQAPPSGSQDAQPPNNDQNGAPAQIPDGSEGGFPHEQAKGVEGFLKEAGLTPSKVAAEIATNGDVTPDILRKLEEKHGPNVAGLVADQLRSLNEATQSQINSQNTEIFNTVAEAFKDVTQQDGSQTWNELSNWAKQNVPNTEREEINKLLAQGGLSAKLAVNELVSRFKSSDSYVQPLDREQGDKLTNDFGTPALDKDGYDRELRKLLDEGHNYATSPQIQQLQKRRMKSMNRGM